MAEITPTQVHDLLTATQDFTHATVAAAQARDHPDHTFLNVARTARVDLRELAAVAGPHHSAIRASIRWAVGPSMPDGWEQQELPIFADLNARMDCPAMTARPRLRTSTARATVVVPNKPAIGM